MLNNRRRGIVTRTFCHPDPIWTRPMRATATAARKLPARIGAADAADLKKLTRQAGEAANLLKLLGNEKRLLILCFLAARGEMTVGELVDVVELSQSALSQH